MEKEKLKQERENLLPIKNYNNNLRKNRSCEENFICLFDSKESNVRLG